jgi:hypothetical protein
VSQSLQIYLQNAVGDRGEQDRDHQSQKLINIEFPPIGGFPDRIKQARAGDDEKEWHHPSGGKNVPEFHPDVGIDILNIPIAQIEESGAVIKKNDQYGQYAKPVKLISSICDNRTHLKPHRLVIFMVHSPDQLVWIFGLVQSVIDVWIHNISKSRKYA